MLAIRAPDHLGDGVMARSAVYALAALGPTRVYAPGWGSVLYAGLDVRPRDEAPDAEIGVLLKPSFGAAWRWRHLRRRIGLATAGRGFLLTDPVPLREEHRREGYARVAAGLGALPVAPPRLPRAAAPELPPGFVGLNPWSPTPAVRWAGYRSLADMLGAPVVFFAGPGEEAQVQAIAGPHPVVAGLSLPAFASALDRCRVFVSNDSGAAHFAAACGTPVVMIHGSTAPGRTGVGVAVSGPPRWCGPCYRKRCPFALGCLTSVPVDAVHRAVEGCVWPPS